MSLHRTMCCGWICLSLLLVSISGLASITPTTTPRWTFDKTTAVRFDCESSIVSLPEGLRRVQLQQSGIGNIDFLPNCVPSLGNFDAVNLTFNISFPSTQTHDIYLFSGRLLDYDSSTAISVLSIAPVRISQDGLFSFQAEAARGYIILIYSGQWAVHQYGFTMQYVNGGVNSICSPDYIPCFRNYPRPLCMPVSWKCNGIDDCGDNSDEAMCEGCCKLPGTVSCCHEGGVCSCDASCALVTGKSDVSMHILGDCNAEKLSQNMYTMDRTGFIAIPWPHSVPSIFIYRWERLPYHSNLSLTVHSANLAGGYMVVSQLDSFEPGFNISSAAGRVWVVPVTGAGLELTITITNKTSFYNLSYSLSVIQHGGTAEAVVQTSPMYTQAQPCDNYFNQPCSYNDLCFLSLQRCDRRMDCPNGQDELGCDPDCEKTEIACPTKVATDSKIKCFKKTERCNGDVTCPNRYDELNCDPMQCGSHNGTFLCADGLCIYETWRCDTQTDCVDGADETDCQYPSLKVITASVIGSLMCIMLIVVAAGCSCKLYQHRQRESSSYSRFTTPMTRIQNQLLLRPPPPPYLEAMQRSRPFEEVQSEFLEQERQRAVAQDGLPLATTSLQDQMESVQEVGGRQDNTKPDECPSDVPMLDVRAADKSDSEGEADTSVTEDLIRSRRQTVRRNSLESDTSFDTHDSDDVPLIA